jgi:hypothetical protein
MSSKLIRRSKGRRGEISLLLNGWGGGGMQTIMYASRFNMDLNWLRKLHQHRSQPLRGLMAEA